MVIVSMAGILGIVRERVREPGLSIHFMFRVVYGKAIQIARLMKLLKAELTSILSL